MAAPVILAIETSHKAGGIALRDPFGRVHVEILNAGHRHEDDLIPAIDRCCLRSGVNAVDFAAVAVSIGPGGFTGVRIGVTTAKLMAEALSIPAIEVPTALAVAEQVKGQGPMVVALSAKAGFAWVTRLERDDDGFWTIVGEAGSTDAIDLRASDRLIADEHLPSAFIAHAAREGKSIEPPVFDAAACLAVGIRLFERGKTVDPLQLAPLYSRRPEAVTLWESRAQS